MRAANTLRLVEPPPAILPAAPRTPEETGLGFSFLVELAAKILFVRGQQRLAELVAAIRLRPGVLMPILEFLRTQNLCEATRHGDSDGAASYKLTDLGRTRATEFMRRCQYAGVAPVGLTDYVKQVETQSVSGMNVTHDRLQQLFSDVVVNGPLLEKFGVAMNSDRAIFVYGPPGSGKTFIAERLVRLLSGAVAVPHALEVNGEVIQIFDPLVHEPVAAAGADAAEIDCGESGDFRWVLCRRPVVMSGAELTLSMVDLEFDRSTRYYHAPQQLKANNGLFILDDLGRQLVSPQELMDRWIVPLDRRIDYLSLHTGQKFMVPFDVIVVFSSNMRPADLADEAFLRRLGHKIFVGSLDEGDYRAILRRECERQGLPYAEAGFDYLRQRHEAESRPMLACQPRDLLGQVCDYARYHGTSPCLSPESLGRAWDSYFARE